MVLDSYQDMQDIVKYAVMWYSIWRQPDLVRRPTAL